MNGIINKLLLVGDIFEPEMYLRQPGFIYVLADHLLKSKKELKNSMKREI